MKDIIQRNLDSFLEGGRDEELGRFLADLHPADVAEILEYEDEDIKRRVFGLLEAEQAAEVLLELSDVAREQILEPIDVDRLSEMVSEMDSDDAADIVAELKAEDAAAVLEAIEPEDSDEVRRLLLYDEESAGGIMQLELISAREDETVTDVIERIRHTGDEVEDLNYVFVVDAQNRLRGWVSLRQLLLARTDQILGELMANCELVVQVDEDQEQVAQDFQKYDVRSAPVVDDQGRLLGRITVDDVFDVYSEEVDEDFYRMAGTSEEEVYSDRILRISRLRLPWLLVNLTGGLVTGYLVWMFKVALQDVFGARHVYSGHNGPGRIGGHAVFHHYCARHGLGSHRYRAGVIGIVQGIPSGPDHGRCMWHWRGSGGPHLARADGSGLDSRFEHAVGHHAVVRPGCGDAGRLPEDEYRPGFGVRTVCHHVQRRDRHSAVYGNRHRAAQINGVT
jgi:CBS domain-containing protein